MQEVCIAKRMYNIMKRWANKSHKWRKRDVKQRSKLDTVDEVSADQGMNSLIVYAKFRFGVNVSFVP